MIAWENLARVIGLVIFWVTNFNLEEEYGCLSHPLVVGDYVFIQFCIGNGLYYERDCL